jgi:hypothetical protein
MLPRGIGGMVVSQLASPIQTLQPTAAAVYGLHGQ